MAASRITNNWLRTALRMNTSAAAAGVDRGKGGPSGDFVPVYVSLGLIMLSFSLGSYTAWEHLAYSPSVRLNKKRRESLPEVEDPESVANEANRFVKKSIFRKVAHLQGLDDRRAGISDRTSSKDHSHLYH
ncbi:hypothetical protein HPP92_008239 [Vanilla planifolia]|uniref:Uncharacterized protein n=1 Tax=Vanilla planifolia TaxID=51239 RepID=A0A835V9H5_VANPL|nr:hypothetical protein HPP92_008239 [Vanilla planifolia]